MDSTLGRSLHPSASADQKYEKLHRMAPPPDKVSKGGLKLEEIYFLPFCAFVRINGSNRASM